MMSLQFVVLLLGDDDERTMVAMLLGVQLGSNPAALAPHSLYAQGRSRNGVFLESSMPSWPCMPVRRETRKPGFLEVCSYHEWGICVVREMRHCLAACLTLRLEGLACQRPAFLPPPLLRDVVRRVRRAINSDPPMHSATRIASRGCHKMPLSAR